MMKKCIVVYINRDSGQETERSEQLINMDYVVKISKSPRNGLVKFLYHDNDHNYVVGDLEDFEDRNILAEALGNVRL